LLKETGFIAITIKFITVPQNPQVLGTWQMYISAIVDSSYWTGSMRSVGFPRTCCS